MSDATPTMPLRDPQPDAGADRQLMAHLRRAVLGTVGGIMLILGLIVPTSYVLLHDFQTRATAGQRIELARELGEQTAYLADRLSHGLNGHARDNLVRQLRKARDAFVAAHADLRQAHVAEAREIFDAGPHHLTRHADAFAHLVDTLTRAGDPRLAAMIAERLDRSALYDFRPGLRALTDLLARQSGQAVLRIQLAGLGFCALMMLGLVGQWLLSYAPVARGLLARTQALVRANEALRQAGLTDPLTGLPNRRALVRELRARIAQGQPVVVLHIDLLRFGIINDTLGRDVGDRLLCHAAAVIGAAAGPADLIARIDGDDFAILPQVAAGAAPTRALAERVIAALARPVSIDGHDLRTQAVIGIAGAAPAARDDASPDDQASARAERLLADAEIALATAPAQGLCVSFTAQMRQRLENRRNTAQDLVQALDRAEIQPYFQPQICATSGRLTGFEALARWHHPTRGVLRPGAFLDIAAGASLSQAINDTIVTQALDRMAGWRDQGLAVPTISLNFAADHLRGPQVVDRLLFDVDRAGLAPGDVVIEVLESALIVDSSDPILATLTGLARAGFHIDIDDFGTGHASFLNLHLIKPNRLKIDRSFVHGMNRDADLRKMTEAMIRLAETLGLESLAEGVETPEEWALLAHLGCTGLQGYAIGHPMPANDVIAWTARHQADLAAGRLIRVA